jgi:hypothetical protein
VRVKLIQLRKTLDVVGVKLIQLRKTPDGVIHWKDCWHVLFRELSSDAIYQGLKRNCPSGLLREEDVNPWVYLCLKAVIKYPVIGYYRKRS